MKQNKKEVQAVHNFFFFQGANASQTHSLKTKVNKKTEYSAKVKKINNNR